MRIKVRQGPDSPPASLRLVPLATGGGHAGSFRRASAVQWVRAGLVPAGAKAVELDGQAGQPGQGERDGDPFGQA